MNLSRYWSEWSDGDRHYRWTLICELWWLLHYFALLVLSLRLGFPFTTANDKQLYIALLAPSCLALFLNAGGLCYFLLRCRYRLLSRTPFVLFVIDVVDVIIQVLPASVENAHLNQADREHVRRINAIGCALQVTCALSLWMYAIYWIKSETDPYGNMPSRLERGTSDYNRGNRSGPRIPRTPTRGRTAVTRPGISNITDSEIAANSCSNYDLPMRDLTSSTLGTLETPVRTPVHQRGFRTANRRGRASPPDSPPPRRPKISLPVGPLRRMNALNENRLSDQITLDEALRDHKLDPKLDDSEIRAAMREMGLETGALRYMKPARRSSELLSTARPLTELLNSKPSVRAVSGEGDVATSADVSRSTTPVVEK